MKKIYTILFLICTTLLANSQTCIIGENFTLYNGRDTGLSGGWIGINLSTANSATANAYTSTASSGVSGPNSFKFSGFSANPSLHATLITPTFIAGSVDSLRFWAKYNSGTAIDSSGNRFKVFAGADTSSLVLLQDYNAISDIGNAAGAAGYKYLAIPSNATVVKFEYTKSFAIVTGGVSSVNIAFDDVCLYNSATITSNNFLAENKLKIRLADNQLVINNAGVNASIRLYNILGQIKMNKKINNVETIDLGNLEPSIYIVSITSNNKTYSKKINVK